MIKNNKGKLIISSIIILIPSIVGIIFWNALPEYMATHWDISGTTDGWSNKIFTVFGLPIILLIFHWICIFATAFDPINKNQNKKVFNIVLWIFPIISLFCNVTIYAIAFDIEFNMLIFPLLLVGLMFILIGNYLPKCKQNYTIGIKIKWTLESEENWNATHRFSGKIWVTGGLFILIYSFLPLALLPYLFVTTLLILAIVPFMYSYMYHKKELKEGVIPRNSLSISKNYKLASRISLVLLPIMLVCIGILFFTGNIEIKYEDTSFTIEASYYNDITVNYSDIESIEFCEQDDKGVRTFGFGSPRLLMGTFQNDAYGNFTRYSYTKCESCVVLSVDGKTLILSGIDNESTKVIYDELVLRHN